MKNMKRIKKNFIFLTIEGTTFQPDSTNMEPDIENLQVIGFSSGVNSKDAFERLLHDNEYLLKTSFDEIFSIELASGNEKTYFSLKG
jgi:hypothetical protein